MSSSCESKSKPKRHRDAAKYYTVRDVAAMVQVTPTTVYRWLASKKLAKTILAGALVRISAEDLNKFLDSDASTQLISDGIPAGKRRRPPIVNPKPGPAKTK